LTTYNFYKNKNKAAAISGLLQSAFDDNGHFLLDFLW